MGFDGKRFVNTRFVPREEDVPVDDLKEWFEKDGKPLWRVRGLTGQELGAVNEAVERNKNIAAILEGLLAPENAEKVESLRKLLGVSDDVPQDIAKRIEMLTRGSVAPECDLDLALKLCENFPIEFYEITQVIIRLTGQGRIPGKSKPSTVTQESRQV